MWMKTRKDIWATFLKLKVEEFWATQNSQPIMRIDDQKLCLDNKN